MREYFVRLKFFSLVSVYKCALCLWLAGRTLGLTKAGLVVTSPRPGSFPVGKPSQSRRRFKVIGTGWVTVPGILNNSRDHSWVASHRFVEWRRERSLLSPFAYSVALIVRTIELCFTKEPKPCPPDANSFRRSNEEKYSSNGQCDEQMLRHSEMQLTRVPNEKLICETQSVHCVFPRK